MHLQTIATNSVQKCIWNVFEWRSVLSSQWIGLWMLSSVLVVGDDGGKDWVWECFESLQFQYPECVISSFAFWRQSTQHWMALSILNATSVNRSFSLVFFFSLSLSLSLFSTIAIVELNAGVIIRCRSLGHDQKSFFSAECKLFFVALAQNIGIRHFNTCDHIIHITCSIRVYVKPVIFPNNSAQLCSTQLFCYVAHPILFTRWEHYQKGWYFFSRRRPLQREFFFFFIDSRPAGYVWMIN